MNDPITFWNGLTGERWVDEQPARDAMLRPFGDAAMHAARLAQGETVLDVGCGCGDTTVTLAGHVGPGGSVLGVDISAPMLARARERCALLLNVTLVEGDAAEHPAPSGRFDLLYSRFGVMFFRAPGAAFAHLRRALKPGGRAAFAVWRPLGDNPWAAIPMKAALEVLGTQQPQDPHAPGPFALGDEARTRSLLEGAGFRDVALRAVDGTMGFGVSTSLDEVARAIARLGPVARLLADRDDATVERTVAALKRVVPPYLRPEGGAQFLAAAWVVTARNGG